jgi:sortase A
MKRDLILKFSAIVLGISGLIILAGVFIPIISYNSLSKDKYPDLISPLPGGSTETEEENLDYTKASNWFIGSEKVNFVSSRVSFYTISIPKLKIENATVSIGGEDLAESLIQYPGTALPGKKGNAVIFGHSVLPIFFNPKDYISIFSTLPNLKEGDFVQVIYDGVTYNYEVENMFEVSPTDIQVLEQNESDSFLTLVTCVPPGDPRKPKRLVVRARIVAPSQSYESPWY